MNSQSINSKQKISPIIQKVIIYGVQNPESLSITRIRNNDIKVGIRKCYTFSQKTAQIVDTTQIQQDKYEMWVYPDGIKISDSSYEIINDLQPQFSFRQPNIIHTQKILGNISSTQGIKQPLDNIYSFVLTDYDLNRTYCTCLVWNEKRFVANDQDQWLSVGELDKTVTLKDKTATQIPNLNSKILPKCTLTQLVQDPLILDPTSSLVYIPKGLIINSPYPCFTFQRQLITFLYMNAIKKIGQTSLHKKQMDQLKNLIAKFGYPEAEKFYDQQEFLSQREFRAKQDQKQLPIKPSQLHSKKTYERMQRQKKQSQLNLKNLRTLQKRKLQEFYLSIAFLPELIQSSNLLDISTQVIKIQDAISSQSSFQFQPYYFSSTCFRMPNFNILSTIQKIGINNLITLWKNAVLQRQILVFSSDQFLTIQLFETLLYLIQPLKWQNIYVPFLPFHLCHHIQALGGYLIGMSKIHMDYMIEHFNLQSKVFVDLDQMIIIQEGGNAVFLFLIEECLNSNTYQTVDGFKDKQLTSQGTDSIWSLPFSRLIRKQTDKNELRQLSRQSTIETIFSVHKVFYVSLFYIYNNYSPYIVEDGNTVHFDRQCYFRLFSTDEDKQFASEIVKTMMFIRLCEFHKDAQKSLKWNQSDICSLFVYCHYIMKQSDTYNLYWELKNFDIIESNEDIRVSSSKQLQSAQKLNQYVNYVLKRNIKQLTSPSVDFKTYKIQHYLVKYLNYINYINPGIVKMQQKQHNPQSFQWFQWIWQIIKKQNIEKEQIKKKQKLNKVHDFWIQGKQIVRLNKLFKNIGNDLYQGLKKNLGIQGWTNSKILQKMKFNRDNAKSSQSAK